jgi:hypothetical protein
LPGVAVAGGEWPPRTVDTQGRINRGIRSERLGVPCILSRSGPTPTRLVNGVCLASASHCPRPRIGSWGRVTRTSTRGGSYHPPGIVPSQPPGSGPSAPRRVLRDRPWPASAGPGPALVPAAPVRLRAFRRGTRRWVGHDRSPPRGRDVPSFPLGAGVCRPSSAPRHGDPAPPSGLGRTLVRDLRSVATGPASAGPTVTLRPFVIVDGSGFGRSLNR